MFLSVFTILEVMDAHLQNNQTAEDNILASPDRLKGRGHTSICTGLNIMCVGSKGLTRSRTVLYSQGIRWTPKSRTCQTL